MFLSCLHFVFLPFYLRLGLLFSIYPSSLLHLKEEVQQSKWSHMIFPTILLLLSTRYEKREKKKKKKKSGKKGHPTHRKRNTIKIATGYHLFYCLKNKNRTGEKGAKRKENADFCYSNLFFPSHCFGSFKKARFHFLTSSFYFHPSKL